VAVFCFSRPELAETFNSRDDFHALSIEPYLFATADVHQDLADGLYALAKRTAGLSLALVSADISPKNILMGPEGPVLLDAKCACYGDPAFDLAFCLNHLLLKTVIRPDYLDR
jgi:Ser/Thr protein kinase RdoA (MazF antagonist)